MKRFFALIIGAGLSLGSAHAVDTITDSNHIPTIVDAIHMVMNTSCEQNINFDRLPGLSAASINNCDEHGWTLLSCAMYKNYTTITATLLERGASIHWSNIHAINYDNAIALRALLPIVQQMFHTIDMQLTRDGYTPLSYALQKNSFKCLAALTECGASLKNTFEMCIAHKNNILFNTLLAKTDPTALDHCLQSIISDCLTNPVLLSNFRGTAGDEQVLSWLKRCSTENQEEKNQHAALVQMISLDIAIHHNSLGELGKALALHAMRVNPQAILKKVLLENATIIAPALTEKKIFISLQEVQPLAHATNEQLIIDYITCYMAYHCKDESLDTIKALYHEAVSKRLNALAHTCTHWLGYKITESSIEHDNLDLFWTQVSRLGAENILLPWHEMLAQALKHNACKIVKWLCLHEEFILPLYQVVDLMHTQNWNCIRIYLNHHLNYLRTCTDKAFREDLFVLETNFKQRVEELRIPALTEWYHKAMLSLVTQQLEEAKKLLRTLINAK